MERHSFRIVSVDFSNQSCLIRRRSNSGQLIRGYRVDLNLLGKHFAFRQNKPEKRFWESLNSFVL